MKDKAILASVTQSRRSVPSNTAPTSEKNNRDISAGTDHTPSTRTSPSGGKQTAAAVGSPLLISPKRDTFKVRHTRDPALPAGPARTPPPSLDISDTDAHTNSPYLSATRGSSVAGGLLSQQEKLSKSTSSLDKVSPDKQTALKQGPPGDFRGSSGNISSSLDERGLRERLLLAHDEKWSSTLSLGLSEVVMEEVKVRERV